MVLKQCCLLIWFLVIDFKDLLWILDSSATIYWRAHLEKMCSTYLVD